MRIVHPTDGAEASTRTAAPPPAPPRISVCIPTIRPGTLAHAVGSVLRQDEPRWELLLVGQGADPALHRELQRLADGDERISAVRLDRTGSSLARNHALRLARAPIVAFLDDDCEASPTWLSSILAVFDADATIGLVAGSLVAPRPQGRHLASVCPEMIVGDLVYRPADTGREAPEGLGFASANFAVRTALLGGIGFDESLGPGTPFPAAEDSDFLMRVEAADVPVALSAAATVQHTYGHRYGVRTVLRHKQAYAVGNGAVAAKQTLAGDARGPAWRGAEIARTWTILRSGRWYRLPAHLFRLGWFLRGYARCVRRCTVDAQTGTLAPRT